MIDDPRKQPPAQPPERMERGSKRPVTVRPPGLRPGAPVPDPETLVFVRPDSAKRFRLRPQDHEPLGDVATPGKSASIAVDLTIESEILQIFGRPAQPEDYIGSVDAGDVRAAGFDVIYAPSRENPLHVRTIEGKNFFDDAGTALLYALFGRAIVRK